MKREEIVKFLEEIILRDLEETYLDFCVEAERDYLTSWGEDKPDENRRQAIKDQGKAVQGLIKYYKERS